MFALKVEGETLKDLRATWTTIEFAEPLPYLNSHLCVAFKSEYLLLIGGDNRKEEYLENEEIPQESEGEDFSNKIFKLHVKKRTFVPIPHDNHDFKPKIAHAGLVHDNSVFVFGGLERQKVFNGQLFRLTLKRSAGEKQEKPPEPKLPATCKFCDTAGDDTLRDSTQASHASQRASTEFDFSRLEVKVKRRLM